MTNLIQAHDITMILVYMFFIFFAGLIWYLRREDQREGFPLVGDMTDTNRYPTGSQPTPKVFRLAEGHELPDRLPERDMAGMLAPTGYVSGSPFVPTGNPLVDGVGPASYAQRADVPDLTFDLHLPKIVPLRVATEMFLAKEDPDPRGWSVVAADGEEVGTVTDIWVDRSEVIVRYFETQVATPAGPRQVLIPVPLADLDSRSRTVTVDALLGSQFADAPTLANPDQITLLEEDKVSAYVAGGLLYATPKRAEPWI